MSRKEADFETKTIRFGYDSKEHNYAVNVPIYQTAAFDLGDVDRAMALWAMEEDGGIYTRIGNPTVSELEKKLSAMTGAASVVGVSSGMAAISYTIMLLGEGGGNFVVGSSLYGGTQEAFTNFYSKHGIVGRFVENRDDPHSYEALIDEETKGIYIETISNPNAEIYDVDAIADIAHAHGIPLIVDNTVATPYLYDPFTHGADIAIYSGTKGLSGHGNVIAGFITEKGGFVYDEKKFPRIYEKSHKIRGVDGVARSPYDIDPVAPLNIALRAFYLEFVGANLSPVDAFLVIQGLDTLALRIRRQVETTEKLVAYLENHPHVLWVRHPSAKKSPYRELAQRDFPKGTGNVVSFGFDGTIEQVNIFFQNLNYFSYHVNIGDVRSLITNPTETTHAELNSSQKALADIPEQLLRISVGLESPEDLIDDLEHGFSAAFSSK